MVTNLKRAEWARVALHAFMRETGCSEIEACGDLLCNLMHWARLSGVDFDDRLAWAREMNRIETEQDTE